MVYDPSTVLLQWQSTALRGNTVTPITPIWPAKDPTEYVTLHADFSLLTVSTDSITALNVAPEDAALKIISAGKQGLVATLILTGGTPGSALPIAMAARLASGSILTRSVILPIIAQPNASALPPLPVPPSGQTIVVDPATGLAVIDPKTGQFVVAS